jgi:hypothetical protein
VHTVSALVFDRLDRHTPPSHNADGAPRGRSDDHWVRKGVMGPGKCENVCKSQSVLVMINTCGIPHPRPTGAYTDDRHVCATCTQRRRRRRRRHSLRPRAPSGRVRGSSLPRSRPPRPPPQAPAHGECDRPTHHERWSGAASRPGSCPLEAPPPGPASRWVAGLGFA